MCDGRYMIRLHQDSDIAMHAATKYHSIGVDKAIVSRLTHHPHYP